MRRFVALNGLEKVGEDLDSLQSFALTEPIKSLAGLRGLHRWSAETTSSPDRLSGACDDLTGEADRVSSQVVGSRSAVEHLLRRHGRAVQERQGSLERLANAAADIHARIATISRVSDVVEGGDSGYGDETDIARRFCRRAGDRVHRALDNTDAEDVATSTGSPTRYTSDRSAPTPSEPSSRDDYSPLVQG